MNSARLIDIKKCEGLMLLAEATVAEVATDADVHPSTIYSWLCDKKRQVASREKCRAVVAALSKRLEEHKEQPAVAKGLSEMDLELPLSVADLVE